MGICCSSKNIVSTELDGAKEIAANADPRNLESSVNSITSKPLSSFVQLHDDAAGELMSEDVPTGHDLQSVLNNSRQCKAFAKFLSYHDESHQGAENSGGHSDHEMRMRFLCFWLDVKNFAQLPQSFFRLVIAKDIVETYISPTAKKNLCLPTSEATELANAIQKCTEEEEESYPTDATFNSVVSEAEDFLTPAFTAFLNSAGPNGLKAHLTQTQRSTHLQRHNSNSSLQEVQLMKTIRSPASFRHFREFLSSRGKAELATFVSDVMQFHDCYDAFEKINTDEKNLPDDKNSRYMYMQMNKIYKKYFKLDSLLSLSGSSCRETTTKFTTMPIKKHTFDAALKEVTETLLGTYMPLYLSSPDYHAFSHRMQENQRRRSERKSRAYATSSSALPTSALNGVKFPTLQELISRREVSYLYEFLETDEEMAATLLFWQEVEELRLLPHVQKNYINARVLKIFNKFIRRGAGMEMELSPDVRSKIMTEMPSPSQRMFDEAQREIYLVLELELYPEFVESEAACRMLNNWTESSTEQQNRRVREAFLATIDLTDVLMTPEWVSLFRKFLVTENCGSALAFWSEVENYKRLPKSDYLANISKKIFGRYVASGAKEKLWCISASTVALTEESLLFPSPTSFVAAQEDVFQFMQNELFPKFRKSSYFKSLDTSNKSSERNVLQEAGSAEGLKQAAGVVSEGGEKNGLQSFLNHADRRKFFIAFCDSSHCVENVYFWVDCEDFKYIPSDDYMRVSANKLYRKYIGPKAKNQVNLKSSNVKEIQQKMECPTRSMFAKAQAEIEHLMENDTFPKFEKSRFKKEFLEYEKQTSSGPKHRFNTFVKKLDFKK